MSKRLILFLLISFCSFSGGINGKSIEESLEEICDRISHCRSDEEAKIIVSEEYWIILCMNLIIKIKKGVMNFIFLKIQKL